MPVNILMPALSPTMEKGNLSKWLKRERDQVKAGELMAEIETDKATMEYESIDDGVLAKIVVPEGTQDVSVNALIGVLALEGEDPKAAAAAKVTEPPARPASAPPPPPHPSPLRGEGVAPSPAQRSVATAPPQAQRARSPQRGEGGGEGAPAQNLGTRVFASPLARRLAKGAGIDIARVQ